MVAILFLILLACLAGVATGVLAAAAIWLRLIFGLLDALVQQVPRGVALFCSLLVGSIRLARAMWQQARRGGVWAAQHAYVWLFVWSFRLREWYVASELKKRGAM